MRSLLGRFDHGYGGLGLWRKLTVELTCQQLPHYELARTVQLAYHSAPLCFTRPGFDLLPSIQRQFGLLTSISLYSISVLCFTFSSVSSFVPLFDLNFGPFLLSSLCVQSWRPDTWSCVTLKSWKWRVDTSLGLGLFWDPTHLRLDPPKTWPKTKIIHVSPLKN